MEFQLSARLKLEALTRPALVTFLFPQTSEELYEPGEPGEFLGYDDLSQYGDGRSYDSYCQSVWGL